MIWSYVVVILVTAVITTIVNTSNEKSKPPRIVRYDTGPVWCFFGDLTYNEVCEVLRTARAYASDFIPRKEGYEYFVTLLEQWKKRMDTIWICGGCGAHNAYDRQFCTHCQRMKANEFNGGLGVSTMSPQQKPPIGPRRPIANCN